MPEVGSVVRFSQSGICRVDRIDNLDFSGEKKEYYVLIPLYKANSTVFVPADNEERVGRMISPMKPEEIERMISEVKKEEPEWIKDFRKRNDYSRKVLLSDDRKALMLLIKGIYRHKAELASGNKYIHNSDDYILKDAEEVLFGEIAHVLNKEYTEVRTDMRIILSE